MFLFESGDSIGQMFERNVTFILILHYLVIDITSD